VVDRVEVIEEREASRMRKCAHRPWVCQSERVLERDLSKLLFREPRVKNLSFFLAREAGRCVARRLA
jgi:hypothetical protein